MITWGRIQENRVMKKDKKPTQKHSPYDYDRLSRQSKKRLGMSDPQDAAKKKQKIVGGTFYGKKWYPNVRKDIAR